MATSLTLAKGDVVRMQMRFSEMQQVDGGDSGQKVTQCAGVDRGYCTEIG